MEYLDKLIPLVILGAVGTFLVYLVRRVATEKDFTPRSEGRATSTPVKEVGVAPLPTLEPLTGVEDSAAVVVSAPPVSKNAKPRRKKPTPPTKIAADVTPIDAALGLLKNKDSLVAAFLLREILAPPVSQRQEPAARAGK